MSKIIHIVNIGEKREIGKNGKLLFRISDDLKHFKTLTQNNIIITGRKNYEDMGDLSGRTTLVITRNKTYQSPFGGKIYVVHSIDEALEKARKLSFGDIYIVGGAEIYQQSIDYADRLEITQVFETDIEADRFYPDFKTLGFIKKEAGKIHKDEKSGLSYRFETWIKK